MFKIIVIGMGRISPNHIKAIMNNRHLNLVGVCDLNLKNINSALKKAEYKDMVNKYIDYKRIISIENPDIVTISTDSESHFVIAEYALKNKCHVIIEKPMALSIKDANYLLGLSEKYKVKITVCHQNRFNKAIQVISKGLIENSFGKVSHIAGHVRWARSEQYYKQAYWRGKWKSDGGCLMNQCIHLADIMYWMLGDIEEVFAYTNNSQHKYIETEDLGLALFKTKEQVYGLFEGTVNVYPNNLEETLYVFGEFGTAKASGKSVNLLEEWDIKGVSKSELAETKRINSEIPPNIYGYGHSKLYNNFVDSIINNKVPMVSGEDGKKAVELILAIYKSQLTGQPVKLPLKQFDILEMEGIFK